MSDNLNAQNDASFSLFDIIFYVFLLTIMFYDLNQSQVEIIIWTHIYAYFFFGGGGWGAEGVRYLFIGCWLDWFSFEVVCKLISIKDSRFCSI